MKSYGFRVVVAIYSQGMTIVVIAYFAVSGQNLSLHEFECLTLRRDISPRIIRGLQSRLLSCVYRESVGQGRYYRKGQVLTVVSVFQRCRAKAGRTLHTGEGESGPGRECIRAGYPVVQCDHRSTSTKVYFIERHTRVPTSARALRHLTQDSSSVVTFPDEEVDVKALATKCSVTVSVA